MRGNLLMLLILIYVALDFANPMMPGAVSFDPSDCVDGVHLERAQAPQAAATIVAPLAGLFTGAVTSRPIVPRARAIPRHRLPLLRVTPPPHVTTADPASPGGDD